MKRALFLLLALAIAGCGTDRPAAPARTVATGKSPPEVELSPTQAANAYRAKKR